MTVHVVGNLCRDTTLRVERFPAPGETLAAASSRSGLGGKGLNQAVAAARAGAPVFLHAAIGAEDRGAVIQMLGTEPELTLRLAELDLPTDTSTVIVRPDGENMIVSATACARAYDPLAGPALGDAVEAGDTLLMQGNLSAARTRACLAEGRRRSMFNVLNPSPLWDDGAMPPRDIDLLVANAGEIRALSGHADASRGAAALRAGGVGAVCVTLGRKGVLYLDATERIEVAAPEVDVHDTSGAGDVFCGVLVGLMARGMDRGQALASAAAAASLSVTRAGALASCPSSAEIAGLAPSTRSRRMR